MSDAQAKPSEPILTIEDAIANLRSPDLSQRYYAAWWLGKMQAREAIDALLIALEDNDDRTDLGGYPLRRAAARALGKLKSQKAIPALIRVLSNEDFYLRESAAQAIASIATTPDGFTIAQICIPRLSELLQSHRIENANPLSQPYEAILEALGQLKANSARHLIESFLNHESPRLRFAAARAMYGLTGEAEFAEQLIQGLKDPDVNIQQVALVDLGEIGYLPAAEAIASCHTEDSFKLFALQGIMETHLPNAALDLELSESLQQVMLLMDDLL